MPKMCCKLSNHFLASVYPVNRKGLAIYRAIFERLTLNVAYISLKFALLIYDCRVSGSPVLRHYKLISFVTFPVVVRAKGNWRT